jgi:hypothetical protein
MARIAAAATSGRTCINIRLRVRAVRTAATIREIGFERKPARSKEGRFLTEGTEETRRATEAEENALRAKCIPFLLGGPQSAFLGALREEPSFLACFFLPLACPTAAG